MMWPQTLCVAVGVWLMAAPALYGYDGTPATLHRIVGPIAAALAAIAMSECTRGVRRANLPLGAALLISPLLATFPPDALAVSVAAGVAVTACAAAPGTPTTRVGGGWSVLWRRRAAGE